ncbi:Tetraspanin-3 [Asimina triloba]
MWRGTNNLIGFINFFTFLLSIPILGGGIWLSSRANQTDCMRFLQWPLIAIGAAIMVVSLLGFAGSCYRLSGLLWLYLFLMFFIIAALFAIIIFSYVVTANGSGRPVLNRAYLEYNLADYSGWLKDRVSDDEYWVKIRSCIRDARICRRMGFTFGGVSETPDMFYLRHLTPIQAEQSRRAEGWSAALKSPKN